MSLELTGRGHELWREGYASGHRDGARFSARMQPQVRLYLDFDGVINALQCLTPWPDSEVKYGFEHGAPLASPNTHVRFDHLWSQGLVNALKALDVELVWATTWTKTASESLGKKLGLGHGARYLAPLNGELTYPTISWKQEALWADQHEFPSPFIWVDDELTHKHEVIVEETFGGTGLVVSSNYYTGVTPQQVAKMQSFIQAMKEPN